MAHTLRAALAMAATTVVTLTVTLTATPAHATPPNIPSASTALSRLNALTVTAESHHSSYDRDLFPHWITITGACNTREQVLKRDGTGVIVNSSCAATSGTWRSPYDGATWTNAVRRRHRPHGAARRGLELRRLGLDHRPAARPTPTTSAGPSCGRSPTTSTSPRATRTPPRGSHPLTSFRCTYARAWIQVKWYYTLTRRQRREVGPQRHARHLLTLSRRAIRPAGRNRRPGWRWRRRPVRACCRWPAASCTARPPRR